MSGRPRLLDLFCGAGGAAMGYHRAGFDVVGVDINPQPNYPFGFVQADIAAWASIDSGHINGLWVWDFDAIHASPPCQAYTSMQSVAKNAEAHPDLIGVTHDILEASELPYVIENVVGAPLRDTFQLCGSSFNLGVRGLDRQLRRHRVFETNWPIGLIPQCRHEGKAVGIYGDHLRMGRRSSDGEYSGAKALYYGSDAMGIDWMTWPELVQAIPPAYTHFIGEQLIRQVTERPEVVAKPKSGALVSEC